MSAHHANPLWYEHNGVAVPERTLAAIRRYVDHGIPPGSFLQSVLTNDLREACGRADSENERSLPAIVAYLYNEVPSICWGSAEKVSAWLGVKADERRAVATEQP